MVGGLGLGYTAHAALLSDRVGQVEVVELLPQVIDWLARGLVPLSPSSRVSSGWLLPRATFTGGLLAQQVTLWT